MHVHQRLYLVGLIMFRLGSSRLSKPVVEDVLATFGWVNRMTIRSHPGVMAISKLIEQRSIVRPRANFTQDIVDEMKFFDEELAQKAQMALDHDVPVNWFTMERIEEELPRLVEEKKQLEAARAEILNRPPGDYSPLKTDTSACIPQPHNIGKWFYQHSPIAEPDKEEYVSGQIDESLITK